MLIAAVVTFPACVLGLGKGGGFVVNPANVHWDIVNPQTALGVGGALPALSVSVALLPVSSVPIKRLLVELVYVPVTGTVTLTLTVQVPLAAIVPFEKESDAAPAVGANAGVPHPEAEAFDGVATTIAPGLVGNVSVKLRPVSVTGVGFVSVKVRVDTPFTLVGSGLKLFAIVTTDGSRI
jgi:hypothetical protein